MRALIATVAAALLCGPAFAESFNFSSGQVVTHRATDLQLVAGVNKIDRKNTMTCTSDAGCSLVIETQFNADWVHDRFAMQGIICTYVDEVAADPGCREEVGTESTLMSFQGKPSLTKGTHVVHTTFTVPSEENFHILNYQLVYTLYQHQ